MGIWKKREDSSIYFPLGLWLEPKKTETLLRISNKESSIQRDVYKNDGKIEKFSRNPQGQLRKGPATENATTFAFPQLDMEEILIRTQGWGHPEAEARTEFCLDIQGTLSHYQRLHQLQREGKKCLSFSFFWSLLLVGS